jgi:hypothetical protein
MIQGRLNTGNACYHSVTDLVLSYLSSINIQKPADCSHLITLDSFTLKMEAICSSETSVHTRSARRHIPEECFIVTAVKTSNLT